LKRLTAAIRDVETELAAMKAEHDPLASHIFISRRYYRNANDTKSGKRREINARLSFNTACELGFRGSLERMGAADRRGYEAVTFSLHLVHRATFPTSVGERKLPPTFA